MLANARIFGALSVALLLLPARASAFCGFYVSGADQSLYSNATMVVLMRDGQRTVLSMQNNYQGPPEDFAMVVPVPTVLQQDNVRTLPREVFTRVDSLAAPRLVEYWEEDPCAVRPEYDMELPVAAPPQSAPATAATAEGFGVRVEAQFAVGEYDIVILSANDSSGLEGWLRHERYNIPAGASQVLRPYVEAGTKFFVARVDVERVTFQNGRAVLSPLRVHYDSPELTLPVRLGLLNSSGQQDLIVHVLARGQRYEVANYANATIPTNIRVRDSVRSQFGSFYEYLFRETVQRNPRTVVTEYAWDSGSCDPCPTPPLEPEHIMTLGGDVVGGANPYGFVLTRLHYRYGRNDLGEDLVFRAAGPLIGGIGVPGPDGTMQPTQSGPNAWGTQFQGRYVILHPWEGAVSCDDPRRGVWGGPPGQGGPPRAMASGNTALTSGIPEAVDGAAYLAQDVPEIGATPGAVNDGSGGDAPTSANRSSNTPRSGGCAGCTVSQTQGAGLAMLSVAALVIALARRRR